MVGGLIRESSSNYWRLFQRIHGGGGTPCSDPTFVSTSSFLVMLTLVVLILELEINTVVPGELQIRHLRDTSFSALDKSAPIVYIGLLTAVLIYCACRCDNSEVGVHELQWFNSGNKGTLQVAMRLLQAPPLCTKSVRVFVKMHAL